MSSRNPPAEHGTGDAGARPPTESPVRKFQRAVRVLASLGKPASQVRLPPEETPCQKAGIDPEGGIGKDGVCKDGQTTVTIANAGSALKVEGRTLSSVSVKSGKTLVTRRYGLTRRFRAKGTFIVARFKVANT